MNPLLLILAFLAFFATITHGLMTTVPQGYVGIHSILNQIQDNPIFSATMYLPGYSSIQLVKFVQDADSVANIKCVTKEGVDTIVPYIEIANEIDHKKVVNTVRQYGFNYDTVLVVDPLAQKMRELCAERTVDELTQSGFHELDDLLKTDIQEQNDLLNTGIKINYVRLHQLTIPQELKNKKLLLAEEKANKILAQEKNKRIKTEKEAELFITQQDGEIKLEQVNKQNKILILNTETKVQEQKLHNQMIIDTAMANSEKVKLEADAMSSMYSIPGFIEIEIAKAISANEKIYYGDKLPLNFPLLQQANTNEIPNGKQSV
jgi:regulator of protease activity HflC (stomatin/prohibitin superfamily)